MEDYLNYEWYLDVYVDAVEDSVDDAYRYRMEGHTPRETFFFTIEDDGCLAIYDSIGFLAEGAAKIQWFDPAQLELSTDCVFRDERVGTDEYGLDMSRDEFIYMLEYTNARGTDWVDVTVTVEGEAPWLTIVTPQQEAQEEKTFLGRRSAAPAVPSFRVEKLEEIRLLCDRDSLPEGEEQQVTLTVRSEGEGSHAACTVHVDVRALRHPACEQAAFMPVKHVVTMEAHHFVSEHTAGGAAFRILPGYGRSGQAVKVYPSTAAFAPGEDAPSLTYRFLAEEEGEYICELWLTPTSPVRPGTPMRCTLTGPDGTQQIVTCVPADYRPGENSDPRWCEAMVSHIRKVKVNIRCTQGLNKVTIGAVDPNFSLERILIYPAGHVMPESYLGPQESACI
jgi:hypothetical protein